jgi:6-pyruvoyl-tetrahydropterin synthase
MAQSLEINHNIEMAHRLTCLGRSKCANIHGHSWRVHLTIVDIMGQPEDGQGNIIMDLGEVKKVMREWLDNTFDHHLALDRDDPLIDLIIELNGKPGLSELFPLATDLFEAFYPGYVLLPGPPTVENMARWIGEYAREQFGTGYGYYVKLYEAATNAATWEG